MALLDDIKLSLRVTSDMFDAEVNNLINAAFGDMQRVGVSSVYTDEASLAASAASTDKDVKAAAALAKQAIVCYCKANFGYDNSEANRFKTSYRQTVADLLNSYANSAATSSTSGDAS